jgi:enoyl-CoA hydratase/carnithine racemase
MPAADSSAPGTAGPLVIERPADGVVLLRLALPERRNAMTEQMTADWTAAVAGLATDRTVRAVVVTGEGTVFCSGGDLSWIEGGGNEVDALRTKMLAFYRAWLSVRELEVPVLAAVNGPAIGAGLCLALACDLRYAAPTARFGAPFTALGMHPGMAASYLLPEAVGLPRAREMFYTGKIVGAEEAAAIGLINGVVPAESLVDEVVATAVKVASMAPVAVRLTKQALRHGPKSYVEALEWEALAQPITMSTADMREGLKAQGERRPPRFEGR